MVLFQKFKQQMQISCEDMRQQSIYSMENVVTEYNTDNRVDADLEYTHRARVAAHTN